VAERTVTDADLRRLDLERREADTQYNEALTKADRAKVPHVVLPGPPPPLEIEHVSRLNERWEIVTARPAQPSGWRGRLGSLVWRMLAPIFERQQEFNASLVQHVNQQLSNEQRSRDVTRLLIASVREHCDALEGLQSELLHYLQQITAFVDTKIRQLDGTFRHQLEGRTDGLAAGLSGVGAEVLRDRDAREAREQRLLAQLSGLASAHQDLGTTVAALKRTAQALQQQIETLAGAGSEGSRQGTARSADAPPAVQAAAGAPPSTNEDHPSSMDYVGFEDAFRGTAEDIRSRLTGYVSLFAGSRDILDVGCGRGELLQLLAEQGVPGRGVDPNHAMVERCRAAGLDVTESDAVAYLETQPDESLGGLVAIQVVEHLQADRLVRLLELAFRKLRPGSWIVLETINPTCWYAFFSSYIRDITHVHPIHPETLRHLLLANGFQQVDVQYRQPYPAWDKLQPVRPDAMAAVSASLGDAGETFNENVAKLNSLLFTHLDYAAVGKRV
jgi:SAM-dependent methyltransferase